MATSPLSIRLFGATSAVGRQLLPRLAHTAADVTASSRVAQANGPALRWLQEALPGAAAVDPATTHILSLGPLDLFVDWLAQQAPAGCLRQVIAFGSTSATTKSDSPAAAERALARRLIDAEETLARESGRLDIAWTLLRPTLIYGGDNDLVARIARFSARWHVHPLPLGRFGRALRQPVHADDLAVATFAAIDNPAAYGRGFDLGGAEALSLARLIARSARAQGNWSLALPAPFSGLLRVAAVLRLLPASAALSPASLQRMAQDQVFDLGPARTALGYAPRPFQPGAA